MVMQWGGDVWDMNIEVNLFALHASNHVGLIAPFVEAFDSVARSPPNYQQGGDVKYYGNFADSGWPLIWTLKSYWRFTSDDPSRRSKTLFQLLKVGLDGLSLQRNGSTVHVVGIGSPEYPGQPWVVLPFRRPHYIVLGFLHTKCYEGRLDDSTARG
jgi:hypothetical protein